MDAVIRIFTINSSCAAVDMPYGIVNSPYLLIILGTEFKTRENSNLGMEEIRVTHAVIYSHFFSFCHIHARYLYERKFV
jgi:hypothetical protein